MDWWFIKPIKSYYGFTHQVQMIQIGYKKNSYTCDVHTDTPTLVYNIEHTHIQCTYICNGHICVQNIAMYILKK